MIDVYRKSVEPQKSFINYATYIALFPQLIAGPIVRYQDIEKELNYREESFVLFSEGVKRFIIGLGKKVLIADAIYQTYTTILATNMTAFSYILVGVCFTLQLYYDFSGYSDMAIGLGKMFGFHFKENFNYPLTASSITDFWRRWHISLSSFLKDYVYIPLGGNKKGIKRQILNLFVVWFLTGLWHGADWNFILWGIYFFVLLTLEKFVLQKHLKNRLISHTYTFVLITISFIIFSIPNLNELKNFFKGCIGINVPLWNKEFLYYLLLNIPLLLIAMIGIGPWLKNNIKKLQKGKWRKRFEWIINEKRIPSHVS
ncbi:MAG: MBOAT family protein [Bacilli bacterium]|nr:MBOAT family protein [Bacilli bacterium]